MPFSQESCVGGFFQPTFFCAGQSAWGCLPVRQAGSRLGREMAAIRQEKGQHSAMTWQGVVEGTVKGLGYELVDIELSAGGLLRVTIDRVPGDPAGEFIVVEDCEKVTRQLQHVLEVENRAYSRLEVSSPGLDRPLKRAADFARFEGDRVALTLKTALKGRKRFSGTLQAASAAGGWRLLLDADPVPAARAKARKPAAQPAQESAPQVLDFQLDEVREARLVPELDFKGRRFLPAAPRHAALVGDGADGVDGGRSE